jgi:glycosyltransferase involved in cell wall biosynthesis
MSKQPLVSVIIPTYNRAGIICRTIDNIFEQTYRNFEVIVVDDGSTDETQRRLVQYGDRIRLITQTNAGPAVARNHGAWVARGEIIAFQDSDDLWKPTKLERQVGLMERDESLPCCLCNVVLRTVNGRDLTSFTVSLIDFKHEQGVWLNVSEVLSTRFVMFNQAIAVRREAFAKLGGFDETLEYLEDYDLPLRLSLVGPWAFIREPLVIYGNGSPLSFSQAALKDPITLKNCEMRICERMLAQGNGNDQKTIFQKNLKRREATFRRELQAIKLARRGSWWAEAMAKVLIKIERYRLAAFRRSPFFPKAITAPLPNIGLEYRTPKATSLVCQTQSYDGTSSHRKH